MIAGASSLRGPVIADEDGQRWPSPEGGHCAGRAAPLLLHGQCARGDAIPGGLARLSQLPSVPSTHPPPSLSVAFTQS